MVFRRNLEMATSVSLIEREFIPSVLAQLLLMMVNAILVLFFPSEISQAAELHLSPAQDPVR